MTINYANPIAIDDPGADAAALKAALRDAAGVDTQVGTATQTALGLKSSIIAVTAKDRGAVGDGVATENTAFGTLSANNSEIFVDAGTYKISPEINLTEKDVHIVLHPDAKFTTAAWDMGPLVKAIGANPVLAYEALFKTIDGDHDLYEHVVGRSIFTICDTTTPTVVSLYSNVEVKQGSGFGSNFGTYVTGAGTGIACEIDSHVTHASGLGYALVIDSIGSYPSQAAIVIQPNGPDSPFNTGISFNNSGDQCIVENAIQFNAGEAQRFIYIDPAATFTTALMETPVFIIGPTVVSATGQLRVDASSSATPKLSAVGSATDIAISVHSKGVGNITLEGGDSLARLVVRGSTGATYAQVLAGSGGVTLSAQGTDTNANFVIQGKGTGGANLLDGAGASKFRVNTTGVGFFATTPVARQTGWGVATGTATKTTFDTSTVTLPQLAERVKALIDVLHSTAGHGLITT